MKAPRVKTMVRRLLHHYKLASHEVRVDGTDWYPLARRIVERMAIEYDYPATTVAGVIAALSPRLQWAPNLRAARAVLRGEVPRGVFSASLRKAQAIADRGTLPYPLDVLGGPKVRAFFLALMGRDDVAVVDTWVLRAVGYDTDKLTPKAYDAISQALRIAAAEVGITTARLQAIAWVAVRGRAA